MVLKSEGFLKVAREGKKFERARRDREYGEGSVFRVTGGHADIFFRQIGTMVRLLPGAELRVETLKSQRKENGLIAKDTLLDLRAGRILTFVRVQFPESRFQVRTAKGLATVTGAGTGRYDIGAAGRFVTAKSSSSALKVVLDGNERYIAPGEAYATRNRKLEPIRPSKNELFLIQVDELEAMAQQLQTPAGDAVSGSGS